MQKTLASLLLLALLSSTAANPNSDSAILAKQLAELNGTKEVFVAYLKECKAPHIAYDPQHVFNNNPAHFGGISPQSAYWPEVVAVFSEYQQRMCNYLTPEDFALYFAEHYRKNLSVEELKAAVTFFSSTAGKKFSLANQNTNSDFQKFASKRMQDIYKSTFPEINEKVLEIIQKYKKMPK